MTTTTSTYYVIDPATGCHAREATAEEIEAYLAQPRPRWARVNVRVGDVVVAEWTGYGVWFGGAGF